MLDGQDQNADIPAHAQTAHNDLLQKRLEGDLCWIVPHVPPTTQLVNGLDWLNWTTPSGPLWWPNPWRDWSEPNWLPSLQKLWLWTLSCDSASHRSRNIKMAHSAAHLDAEPFWWWQCSARHSFPLPPPPGILVPARPLRRQLRVIQVWEQHWSWQCDLSGLYLPCIFCTSDESYQRWLACLFLCPLLHMWH